MDPGPGKGKSYKADFISFVFSLNQPSHLRYFSKTIVFFELRVLLSPIVPLFFSDLSDPLFYLIADQSLDLWSLPSYVFFPSNALPF